MPIVDLFFKAELYGLGLKYLTTELSPLTLG